MHDFLLYTIIGLLGLFAHLNQLHQANQPYRPNRHTQPVPSQLQCSSAVKQRSGQWLSEAYNCFPRSCISASPSSMPSVVRTKMLGHVNFSLVGAIVLPCGSRTGINNFSIVEGSRAPIPASRTPLSPNEPNTRSQTMAAQP